MRTIERERCRFHFVGGFTVVVANLPPEIVVDKHLLQAGRTCSASVSSLDRSKRRES